MNAIELPRPHGFLIWQGKQTAIADAEALPVGEKLLIVSNGEAFGYATLGEAAQIKTEAFHNGDWQDQHCIFERERRQFWPDAKMLYVHRIADWQPFEQAKAFENGKAVDKQLTDSDRKLIDQAKQLPKMICLDAEAVVFCGGKFVASKIAYTDELKAILKATYDQEPEFIDHIDADQLPIYQLALVRNPNMNVKKKEDEKQEDIDMPWEKTQNHPGCSESEPWAVVKVDNGEVEGCHVSEEAANAQLAALNIAEAEQSLHNDDDEEEKQDEAPRSEALEQRLVRIQEQFFRVDNANIVHTFEDHLIVESGGELFNVNFSQVGDQLVFDPREKWSQVDVSFTPRVASDSRSWKDKLVDAAKTIFKTKDQPTEDDDIFHIGDEPFGIAVKDVNGQPWHFTWSTNAFEDREGEIFTTKALENFVKESEEKGFAGVFDFWHIDGTEFAEKKWKGVIGRILIEAGPYFDDEAGRAAKEFFAKFPNGHPEIAPEGWGASPKFRFLPEERMKDGILNWLWITKTSTLPRAAAANIHTEGKQIMALTEDQKKAAVEIFGKNFVETLTTDAEKKTAELEDAGVAHKEIETAEAEAETQEAETEEATTEEETEQPAVVDVDLNELAAAVSDQFVLKLEPITEAMVQMAEAAKAVEERVAKIERREAIKAQVETPRLQLNLVQRASEAVETVVGDNDDLKEKGPKQRSPVEDGASVANAFFTK